jgi:hypothetical protein
VCECALTEGRSTRRNPLSTWPTMCVYVCVKRVLQGCYNSVTHMLQGCYKYVTDRANIHASSVYGCYKSVTNMLQGCLKYVTSMLPISLTSKPRVCRGVEGCSEYTHTPVTANEGRQVVLDGPAKCYNTVTRVLQGCCKGVARVLQVWYKSVTRVLQECCRPVSPFVATPPAPSLAPVRRVLEGCQKGVRRVSEGCYKGVTRVLQGCYKGVTRALQGCYKPPTHTCSNSTCSSANAASAFDFSSASSLPSL